MKATLSIIANAAVFVDLLREGEAGDSLEADDGETWDGLRLGATLAHAEGLVLKLSPVELRSACPCGAMSGRDKVAQRLMQGWQHPAGDLARARGADLNGLQPGADVPGLQWLGITQDKAMEQNLQVRIKGQLLARGVACTLITACQAFACRPVDGEDEVFEITVASAAVRFLPVGCRTVTLPQGGSQS